MRSPLRIAALAAAIAWLPSFSLAQSFDKRIGHWRVVAAGLCLAFNRPANELNASPYNSLFLQLGKGGRWGLGINFWPKAVMANAEVQIAFAFGGSDFVRQRALAFSDYGVSLDEFSARLRDEMTKVANGLVSVTAEGLTTQLYFDIADIAAVFAALEECAKTLR
jgi:hypothetical protein